MVEPVTEPILQKDELHTSWLSRQFSKSRRLPALSVPVTSRTGLIVAVIGADGSGKSTVTQNLTKTFATKVDLCRIYFGRGDGKASWNRKQLSIFKTILVNKKTRPESGNGRAHPAKGKSLIRILYKCTQALLVAREKHRNLKLMLSEKSKGSLVICDRYPQNQIMEYNDGPMLHEFLKSRNPLLRMLATLESRPYAYAESHPPDIVFKLVTDAITAESRKPGETPLEKLKMKIEGIKRLKFKDPCNVITVDATKPLSEVLGFIKDEIWAELSSASADIAKSEGCYDHGLSE